PLPGIVPTISGRPGMQMCVPHLDTRTSESHRQVDVQLPRGTAARGSAGGHVGELASSARSWQDARLHGPRPAAARRGGSNRPRVRVPHTGRMRVETATEPGTPDRPNEDFVAIAMPASGGGGSLVLLDGVTPPDGPTGCRHTVPWYVSELGGSM